MEKPIHESTIVIKNNIPFTHLGVHLSDRYGIGYALSFDVERTNDLYFQPQIFLQILKEGTTEILFEFRTLCIFICSKRIDDIGFYEEIYSYLLLAIDGFNWHLKINKSTLTMHKTYSPIPSFEQAKNPIRQAYSMLNFNNRPSKN